MPTEEHQSDHWKELAELLGLPSESSSTPVPLVQEKPEVRGQEVKPHVLEEEAQCESSPTSPISSEESESEEGASGPEPFPESAPAEQREDFPEREGRPREGRQREGRQRGRRRGRRKPDAEGSFRDTERKEPRGRKRTRPDPNFTEENQTPPEPETDRLEDEDEEDLSDWTVPSWTELIASLYRPDR